jgi:hypothetical protein
MDQDEMFIFMEQTWLPQAVLDADWSIPKTFFESESV